MRAKWHSAIARFAYATRIDTSDTPNELRNRSQSLAITLPVRVHGTNPACGGAPTAIEVIRPEAGTTHVVPTADVDRLERTHSAAAFPPNTCGRPEICIAGVNIRGIGSSLMRSGSIHLDVALRPGIHEIKGKSSPGRVQISEGTRLQADLRIDRDGETVRITKLRAHFGGDASSVRILNPGSAYRPTDGWFSGIVDFVRDRLASVRVDGAHVEPDGRVALEAELETPFGVANGPVQLKPHETLKLVMSVDDILDGKGLIADASSSAENASSGYGELMEKLGSMCEGGKIELALDCDPTQINVAGDRFQLETTDGPIRVTGGGAITVSPEGVLTAQPELHADLPSIHSDVSANLRVYFDADDELHAAGDATTKLKLGAVRGGVTVGDGLVVPFAAVGGHDVITIRNAFALADMRAKRRPPPAA